MKKRAALKKEKTAAQKIIAGIPLTTKERAAFNQSIESWLGPTIVKKIKTLGK